MKPLFIFLSILFYSELHSQTQTTSRISSEYMEDIQKIVAARKKQTDLTRRAYIETIRELTKLRSQYINLPDSIVATIPLFSHRTEAVAATGLQIDSLLTKIDILDDDVIKPYSSISKAQKQSAVQKE